MKYHEKLTCSKIILLLVAISYFVGLIGLIILIIYMATLDDTMSMSNLAQAGLIYIGGPVAVSVAFYEWKAKHENVLKITKGLAKSGNSELASSYYGINNVSSDIVPDDAIIDNINEFD